MDGDGWRLEYFRKGNNAPSIRQQFSDFSEAIGWVRDFLNGYITVLGNVSDRAEHIIMREMATGNKVVLERMMSVMPGS